MDKRVYDYLVVRNRSFGSVFTLQADKRVKKCLVIEKRAHIGESVNPKEQALLLKASGIYSKLIKYYWKKKFGCFRIVLPVFGYTISGGSPAKYWYYYMHEIFASALKCVCSFQLN